MDTSESHSRAVERFEAAREERDRRAGQYEAASGSPEELPAFTELRAAEDQLAAREAWLKWGEAGLLGACSRGSRNQHRTEAKDERRAEKLRQVARRIKHGSSMARRMTPVKRAAHTERQRRQRP
jgi:hypothetical protein